MRSIVRTVVACAAIFGVTWVCLAAAAAGGWWPFTVGCIFCALFVAALLRCMPHDEPAPASWGLVEYGGIRVAGRLEERTDGVTSWLAVTPPGRHTITIRRSLVDRVLPCSEEQARRYAARQWVGRAS